MSLLVHFLNQICTLILDLMCLPWRRLAPEWVLVWVSLLTSVLVLWVFRRASDQDAIRVVKTRIRGNLIGLRLYQAEMPAFLRLQGSIGIDLVRYLGRCLRPLLVLTIPLVLILAQLELRLGAHPLRVGDTSVVTARTAGPDDVFLPTRLEPPPGIVVETPAVKIPVRSEVSWRIRAEQEGEFRLRVHQGENVYDKTIVVADGWSKLTPWRRSDGAINLLLHPGEPPLPTDTPLRAIGVHYGPAEIALFGMGAPWWVWFLILTLVFCLLLRRPLRVEF